MKRRSMLHYSFMFPLLFPLGVVEPEKTVEEPEVTKPKIEILLFSATWCGPCQSLKSKLKRSGLYDKVILMDCSDGSDYSKFARKYKFKGVPTIVVLKDGKEIDRGRTVELVKKYTTK